MQSTCKRCLLQHEIDEAQYTASGCNFCDTYMSRLNQINQVNKSGFQKDIAYRVKQNKGPNQEYDCVIGVSGGTDSSYLVDWAHEHRLNALLVHVDNGWNTELSTRNIELLSKGTGFPLVTVVLNWSNFRDIQKAFVEAGLKELEFATDHAIKFGVYQTAKKHGIKSILSGRNLVTEGILPEAWSYGPLDRKFLLSVCSRHGVSIDKSFPSQSLFSYLFDRITRRYQEYFPLNYVEQSSDEWKMKLEKKYGWKKYDQKHFESTWTKFYQGYWLPKRFGIDKRRAHLFVKLLRGEITRTNAIEQLNQPMLPTDYEHTELKYVAEKLNIPASELISFSCKGDTPVSEFRNNKVFFDLLHTPTYIAVRRFLLS